MVLYLSSIVAFLAGTMLAIWRLRFGTARTIVPALMLVAGSYVTMVTARTMTEATATVAVLTIDLALLAVGMAASWRLLGGWDRNVDDGRGRDDDPGDGSLPDAPAGGSGARFNAWDAFDDARRHWEREAQRRERQDEARDREHHQGGPEDS